MDVKWVKIRSWHAAFDAGRGQQLPMHHCMCGRFADGEAVAALPAEKSCETCLRIVARLQDA